MRESFTTTVPLADLMRGLRTFDVEDDVNVVLEIDDHGELNISLEVPATITIPKVTTTS